MSASEQFYCSGLAFLASVILVIVGSVQFYFSSVDVNQIDYTHLVVQILAGLWSMATGALSIYSLWNNSLADSMVVLGKKIFLFINFVVEILATSLLLAEMGGANVSMKQHIPAFRESPHLISLQAQAKDTMYLTTSGSLSIFMGMIIWVTTLCSFPKKEYLDGDFDVKFLSARCKVGSETETFHLNNAFVWPKYLSRRQSLQTIKDSRKKERDLKNPDQKLKTILVPKIPKEVELKKSERSNSDKILSVHKEKTPVQNRADKTPSVHKEKTPVQNREDKIPSVHKENTPVQNRAAKEAKQTTYIRFYDDDDCEESPSKETLYVSDENEKKMTPLACIKRYSISPRRSPLKVATPTPPKHFSGKRTLSSPFRSNILRTINENESLKLISPQSFSTFHTPCSRPFGTWSSGCYSSASRSSDYQSVFSSCSSPDVSSP